MTENETEVQEQEASSTDESMVFVEDEQEGGTSTEQDQTESDQSGDSTESTDEEDELELFLGEESQSTPSVEDKNPDLVKNLRKEIQERNKRIHELESQTKSAPQSVDIHEKLILPTLESANYDEDKYQKALVSYFDKKAAQEKAKLEQEEQNKLFQVQHQEKIKTYNERKSQLKVKDYGEMERIVIDEVPDSVQGAILHYATQPELVVLAAGRNEKIRKELSQATDPVKLGILIGQIEAKAKLLPKSKTDKPSSAPSVKGAETAKKQDVDDARFRKLFPGAVIE